MINFRRRNEDYFIGAMAAVMLIGIIAISALVGYGFGLNPYCVFEEGDAA